MVSSPTCPCSPVNISQDIIDVLGEVVVLVQSESGSESGSDTETDNAPGTPLETGTPLEPGTPLETGTPLATDTPPTPLGSVPFDPVTFPADRVATWLQYVSIPEGIETDTDSPIGSQSATPLDETLEVPVTPKTAVALETCTSLLNKLEEVKLAVLHLQYSLRVGTTGPREPRLEAQDRAHRLWSWDHAGVFLAELPCP